jgi:sRNA-binding regulator protein Hfq
MGFNKRIMLKKYQLQQMVYDHGVKYVVDYYSKADAIIGDAETI